MHAMTSPIVIDSPILLLDDLAKQYKRVTRWEILGILLLPIGFVSAIIILWAIRQKAALREKVVALGYGVDLWERPLRAYSRRVLGGSVLFVIAALITAILVFAKLAQS